MFVVIDTNTDDAAGQIPGGATHIDVLNSGASEATLTIAGVSVPILPGSTWSSGYTNTGFGPFAYTAVAGSRLIIIAWD